MTLWLILTIMTAAAAIWASVPLIRRFDRSQAESVSDIEIYRDQLQEVEHELRQGLIDDTQAEMARVEIKRRILAADSSQRAVTPKLSGGERNFAVICVAGIVVLGSVGLYAVTGSPELASWRAPYGEEYREGAQRGFTAFSSDSSAQKGFAAASQTRISESDGELRTHAGLPSVDEMIQRLAVRLMRNPKDTEGWRTLGWSYLNIGRFQEAAEAYARAVELGPDIAELRGDRIEALVAAADGIVTSEAKTAIEDTLKLDPKNVQARFFLGLAEEQEGDKASALAEWTELLKDADSDEPWAVDLKNRISELRRNTGIDGGSRPAEPKSVIVGGMRGIMRAQRGSQTPREVENGPSPEDVQAAQAMPPADRAVMIREMVEGLANRLEQSPRDADGWIKLIRSRMVLGESKLAKQALARGLNVFADDAGERDRIAAAAQQLGLNQ
jgi:cytochrome c-type biogenesis protein CcmH